MKPVVLISVYRRYFELTKCLENLNNLLDEFPCKPEVVVVWAAPELGHLWFFEDLIKSGKVNRVISRPKLPQDGIGKTTTYSESRNIRLGLEFIKSNYQDVYVIFQAADAWPRKGRGYTFVNTKMLNGAKAAVLHLANATVRANIWHTNFFAVCMDERYWPPVSPANSDDILEFQWGKYLDWQNLPYIAKNTNTNNYWFAHEHLSENQPPIPIIPIYGYEQVSLCIKGYERWWKRLIRFFWRKKCQK